jgi:hypothetical protein
MQTALDHARSQFARMPGEVFDLWLREAVADRGWPFVTGTEPTMGTVWERFFLGQSLSYWSSLSWRPSAAAFEDVVWGGEALERAAALVREVRGIKSFDVSVENSGARFQRCSEFLARYGKLPAPLVCAADDEGAWHLVDGHHRLAALIGSVSGEELDEFRIEAWLGEAPNAL